ncbi:CRISPR-associated protein Cas7 [Prevotella sp. A2931]|uniref:CRISPR-associated protein Cas7 n=1 Tax=Prevotella illustrans TaxID=2800387 RepID=A0ABS3M6U5_9BACT|nr:MULTISPECIES: CRISPR-associated protein Cas7 [Prevotella]MBO1363888.1 CRISPR-associated protein Cas7 [Prevotella illustrans]PTL26302.1 CRISPR-associated protein Cas7 [Prevotella sp. oral taxon 820]
MNPYIYLRALKHADHTVFCVSDGQKSYYDAQFNKSVPFSSGQQVKRSILQTIVDELNVPMAPITFNYNISAKKELENKEPWSPCDPTYVDQLLGGWMKAAGDGPTLKRRSPLSISAMKALHPLLAGTYKENLTFDRSDRPDYHPVNVRLTGSDRLLSEEEIETFLYENNRTLSRRNWIPDNKRASGLFVSDIAIDLRTLFCVSVNQHEPELTKEKIEELKSNGWIESENVFGKCLVLPKTERDRIIPALAHGLINWRITSNQARTFSLMETLAVAISDNANTIPAAIRAKLIDNGENPKAKPIIDETAGAKVFVTLPCAAYVQTESESSDALKQAENRLIELMSAFDYEKQV